MKKIPLFCVSVLLIACTLVAMPVSAALEEVLVYSSDFSSDPGFTTNNPSRYYWDVANQTYHFETEGGTNGYSFIPVDLEQIWPVAQAIAFIGQNTPGKQIHAGILLINRRKILGLKENIRIVIDGSTQSIPQT